MELRLRPARCDEVDARLVMSWRNDPATRAASFTSDPIDWDAHWLWYRGVISSERHRLFVGQSGAAPIGVLRLDWQHETGEAEVNIAVDPSWRGRGIGPRLLALGLQAGSRTWPVTRFLARIKPDNGASVAAFERAGFREAGRGRHPRTGEEFLLFEHTGPSLEP